MIALTELISISQQRMIGTHPELILRVIRLVKFAYVDGMAFAAFQGERTWEQQAALYAQGRTAPGKIVTKAGPGDSGHNYGLAVDLVEDGDPDMAGIQWSWKNNADYLKLGKLAKSSGLEWGGFWKSFQDYPHVSLTCGLTLSEAKALYLAGGKQKVWDEINRRLAAGITGSGW